MRTSLFIVAFISESVSSCPSLDGTWRSNHKLTLDYTASYAKIPEHAYEFINQVVGTAEITYSQGVMTMKDVPTREVEISGKSYGWKGTNESVAYVNLGCTPYSVAIKYTMYNQEIISLLNFVDNNTYWVYMGSPLLEDVSNSREYFVKVK